MKLIDYLIQIGNKQGNSKHFKNFSKIHSYIMRIERENRLAKEMINAKNDLLIFRERKEKELSSEISRLKIELHQKNIELEKKDKQIEDLKTDIEKDFLEVLDSWQLK